MTVDFAEIRFYEILYSRLCSRHGERIEDYRNHQHEEYGGGNLCKLLYSLADPESDNAEVEGKENREPAYSRPFVADQSPEHSLVRFPCCSSIYKGEAQGLEQVRQRPSSYHAVERQDDDRGDHTQQSHPFPACARGQLFKCPESAELSALPYVCLTDEDRNTDKDGGKQINENEGGSSVLSDHVGESPDIAQAYG